MTIAQRVLDAAQATGNGIAYAVFAVIGLILLYFLIRWGYTEYRISQHCTMVLGTRVCK
jgi:uncharacterized membrane protein YdbT with pleckstrin-like domain